MKRFALTLTVLALGAATLLAGEPGGKLSPEVYKKINGKLDEIKANPRKAKAVMAQVAKQVDANRAALLGALKEGSALERTLAAKVLCLSTGEKDKVAAALIAAMKDPDLLVRRAAAGGLARMKAPASADAFMTALTDVDEIIRATAAKALGTLKVAKAKDALVKALEDENWRVRLYACQALGAIVGDADKAEIASKLKPLLEDENAWVRMAAAGLVQKLSGVKPEAGGPKKKDDENVLHELAKEMSGVKDELEAEHHGVEVRVAQGEITKKLDQLIEMIKKQQQQSQSQSKGKGKGKPKPGEKKPGGSKPGNQAGKKPGKQGGQNPSSPMQGEFMTSGGVQHGDKAKLGDVGAEWGKLPPQERDKLLQAVQADLPERYRQMLEVYLRSISEESGR